MEVGQRPDREDFFHEREGKPPKGVHYKQGNGDILNKDITKGGGDGTCSIIKCWTSFCIIRILITTSS